MAKKSAADKSINKSEEIRNTIRSGVKKPKEVQAKLAERGIKVSTQMISTVKGNMSARRKARKIGRARAAVNAAANNGAPPTDIKSLARFIRAVHDVGGLKEAHKILREMEE